MAEKTQESVHRIKGNDVVGAIRIGTVRVLARCRDDSGGDARQMYAQLHIGKCAIVEISIEARCRTMGGRRFGHMKHVHELEHAIREFFCSVAAYQ